MDSKSSTIFFKDISSYDNIPRIQYGKINPWKSMLKTNSLNINNRIFESSFCMAQVPLPIELQNTDYG